MAIASAWRKTRLGDVARIKHGWPFKSECFCEWGPGLPVVVNIGNFQYTGGFRFETTQLKGYHGEYPKEYELSPGDVLLVMTCQTAGGEILGIPGRIPGNGCMYLHNQRMGKVVVTRPDLIDLYYLYWIFLWKDFNQELVASSSGTKILHTAPTRIEAFHFSLPPLDEQRAIARILGALDDKIESNRRMNGTLEAMAQALFKAWFVDFDPVVAKREGRKPVGMDDATAALFPERFQDTAMGPVPAGWKQGRIGDVLALSRASINPSDYPDETFSHYSIPAFDSGATPIKELGASIKSNKYRIPDICVLISKLNPETPRVWTPSGPFEHLAICSTEFFVTVPRQPFSTAYVFSLLGSKEFTEEFATFVTGTSNSHQRVKPDDFLNMLAVSPRREIVEAFDQRVAILLNRAQRARKQSSSLASLRDALLPKLLSGDLTVGQTEKIVEES